MKRGVNDFQFVSLLFDGFRTKHQFFQGFHVFVVDLASDDFIEACGFGVFLTHGLQCAVIGDRLHFIDDLHIFGSGDLGAVLPVNLVTVVLRRVVAGCHHNACGAVELTNGKGQHRCRTKRRKNVSFDSVGCHAECGLFCKFRGHVAGVKRNRHTFFLRMLFDDKVCQSLRCLSYRVNIHAVGSCSQNSAQTSGTKLQLSVKPLCDLFLVVLDGKELRFGGLVKIRGGAPKFIIFHCIHSNSPPYASPFSAAQCFCVSEAGNA